MRVGSSGASESIDRPPYPSAGVAGNVPGMNATKTLQRWICESCGYIYDPDDGDPDGGIPAGTVVRGHPRHVVLPGMRRAQAGLHSLRGLEADLTDWPMLLALDRERVWHPYGGLPAAPPEPLPVVSARGVRLRLADGRELIDGMASWWCAIHGYRHPALDEAVREQLERMAHVMFGGLTHEPAIASGRALGRARARRAWSACSSPTPGRCRWRSRSSSRSSTSARCGHADRTRLLTVRGGYHGDTFGAMAVCDPIGGMHSLFTGVLAEHVFAERPPGGFDAGLDARWAEHVQRAGRRARA